ncbi:hypothetical protein DI396_04050 [Litorivita pollutaquae]|uniref:Uncharacterized protein n=1 Tax=Litorivita pollutaquae TaxID=2200892 RepID=A0A2V4MRK9_9RHOB|nr:hypothetical protein DI396_04050 [Litorivita pollutaquae]
MPRRYILGMAYPHARQPDNLGDFGQLAPLTRLQRSRRNHWNRSQDEWERMQARRIAQDLAAFSDQRYRGVRVQVFAEVFLTLGALCAAKAGFSRADIQEFVEGEQVKANGPNRLGVGEPDNAEGGSSFPFPKKSGKRDG